MKCITLIIILFCQNSESDLIDVLQQSINIPVQDFKFSTNFLNNINSMKPNISEDGLLDFKGLAKKYVRPAEEFDVETVDGYIIKLFHIPGKTSKVVLLSHGLLLSSDDFIIRGKTSLIYMLAQQGYDIWAINFRGSRYSRRHKTLNPDIQPQYWDFYMQEWGYYDLATVIDFILYRTGLKQLDIVGHSEGSAAVFVLASTRPEYNDKINVFISLSAGCHIAHSGIGIKALVRLRTVIADLSSSLGIVEVFGYNSWTQRLAAYFCSRSTKGYYDICVTLLGIIGGYDSENMEPEFFRTLMGHFPAGSSKKNVLHYTQIGSSGNFAQFDYGSQNRKMYGLDKPPVYNLSNVTCKVAIIGAKNDLIVTIEDVIRVRNELPNVVSYYVVINDKFNHFDYVWGRDAHKVLYSHVINVLNELNVYH